MKELLMNNLKKAHNFRHICMLKSNVGKVAQALLSKSQGSQGTQGTLEGAMPLGVLADTGGAG